MADRSHLAVLTEGVAAWNRWRNDNRQTRADLALADRREADLRWADFSEASLYQAKLGGADLSAANFSHANLSGVSLQRANLQNGWFVGTDLYGADLREADLRWADLRGANLHWADTAGADLRGAHLGHTVLAGCTTLCLAGGLAQAVHEAPSILDHHTLRACVAELPDAFLQGVGYTAQEIATLRELYSKGVQYCSCFLSYGSPDAEFVSQLRAGLDAEGIRLWDYRRDMRGGDHWRGQISRAIVHHEKLLLVCSRESLGRTDVVEEVLEAIEDERVIGSRKLFPVAVDCYVYDVTYDEAMNRLPPRQRRENWLTYLRAYHIPDFSRWREPDAWQAGLQALLRDLRAS